MRRTSGRPEDVSGFAIRTADGSVMELVVGALDLADAARCRQPRRCCSVVRVRREPPCDTPRDPR
ncbi:MAG: hypothetical protein MUE82_03940 [Chloroflexi bacterium]|nr:hypothetical protein [Chloroflexota bacterium]